MATSDRGEFSTRSRDGLLIEKTCPTILRSLLAQLPKAIEKETGFKSWTHDHRKGVRGLRAPN
jgi:hypothetical protein